MERRDRDRLFSWINILAALTAGLIIYLRYGEGTYIAGFVSRVFHMDLAQEQFCGSPVGMVGFLRCYGCDMLWSYALVHTFWLFAGSCKRDLYWMCAVSWLFGTAMECLQAADILKGTFDILDMVFEGIAAGAAGLIICFWLFLKERRK